MSSFPYVDQSLHNAFLTVEMANNNVAGFVEELGRFAASSQFIVGVTVVGKAEKDRTAFAGGHTVKYREDYGTMSVSLDTPEGIRHATRLFISEERAAEIVDAYVLPGHLRNPDNHVDAFIGHIIKGLVGYTDDVNDSFQEQAVASTDTIAAIPGITDKQALAFRLHGLVNLSDAQKNVLYRGQQVETLEHVLRFLIARENAKPYTKGNIYAGVDYQWATGILAEALQIVNGGNEFNQEGDHTSNDLVYRGTLQQRSSVAIEDRVVYVSGVGGPKPIWPPETVEAYEAEQIKAARIRVAEQAQERLVRDAEEATRQAAATQQAKEIQQTMKTLAEEGFGWRGIMQITPVGPMDSPDKIRAFYMEKYGVAEEDVRIVTGVAIYGGREVHFDAKSVTVYIRQ
jgi:hypothetical protein